MHIVLVEDNKLLAESVSKVLKQEGYSVTHIVDGVESYKWILNNNESIDLIVLDILLPNKDGFEICQDIRIEGIKTPVLMLTSKDATEDIVNGLNCGADDYLKKPFIFEEFLARIRALLRRPKNSIKEKIKLTPDVEIDLSSHKAIKMKKEVELTAKEFGILSYFIHNPNTIINQQELYDHAFDFAEVQLSNSVEVHIKNLRKKLNTNNYEIPLKTIRGAGYRLDI
jgi:DNA-binding response OmpR family regulator